MTASTRRERRRAATVQEILDAAERQVIEVGAHALSLRGVAREVGMTVQSLYNYFSGRDDLITALVAAAHDDLAVAVETARDAQAAAASGDRIVAVARAYREWAVANPTRFGLAYGPPLADYAAPPKGPTTIGPKRMAAVFADVVFRHWTPQERAGVPMPGDATQLIERETAEPAPTGDLPPAAAALLLVAWGRMHGMVTLEAFGHLSWIGGAAPALFDEAMWLLVGDLEALRQAATGSRRSAGTDRSPR